jgi:regulatory protein
MVGSSCETGGIEALPRGRKSGVAGDAADPGALRAAAVALLTRRDYASAELRARLESSGYEPAAVAHVVRELTDERLLDDARFVENYVAAHAERGEGPVRISADLQALQLEGALLDAALAAQDWPARARAVRLRKFGQALPHSWAQKARQARFLQYRGFSSDHIRSALGPDFDPDAPA